jgi:biopolymer transport protein ExbD
MNRPKTPELDMNPMVDMAFLLVTFFLLATTFKTADPARIVLPRSVSTQQLPDNIVITIAVSRDGRSFIGIDNPHFREKWLERFTALYDLELTSDERRTFMMLTTFGVPASELKDFLSMTTEQRARWTQPGIPVEENYNELKDWIILARTVMPRARIAIRADQSTPYEYVSETIKTLTDNNILRFNLATDIRRFYNGG